jgi:NAD(P)-dependent dehydrogenase (short-subunit alcohol dehydrogenase family)
MALAFAKEGAKVVSVARTMTELNSLENEIRGQGGEILTVQTDLSQESEIFQLKDKIMETWGRVDTLVNNAAMSSWQTLEEMPIKTFDLTIAVNLRAPFILSKIFAEIMKEQGGGSIINVSSRSAEIGFVAEMAYCPTKFALVGLTQCLALELKLSNIAVNSIGVGAPPGKRLKPTNLTLAEAEKLPKEIKDQYADDNEMVVTFRDVWTLLALQDGSGITGQYFTLRDLKDFLQKNGWDATIEKWRGKLTEAIYTPYKFPKSVRYQTPEGGFKELTFE